MPFTYSRQALTGLQRQEWDVVLHQICYAVNEREHAAQKHYSSGATKTYTKWYTKTQAEKDYRTLTLTDFQGSRIAEPDVAWTGDWLVKANVLRARGAIQRLAYRSGVGRFWATNTPSVFLKSDYSLWGSAAAFLTDAIGKSSWTALDRCGDVTPWLELYDALQKLTVVNVPGWWIDSGEVTDYGGLTFNGTASGPASPDSWQGLWDEALAQTQEDADLRAEWLAFYGSALSYPGPVAPYGSYYSPGWAVWTTDEYMAPFKPWMVWMQLGPKKVNTMWPTSLTGRLKRLYWRYEYGAYPAPSQYPTVHFCDGTDVTLSDTDPHERYWEADLDLPLADSYTDSLSPPATYPWSGQGDDGYVELQYAAAVNIASELTYG